eukprot:TRINITY_DN2077_c0_g2_i2.p1 TRINITY_DN2077_c0_g2~~TRINITY_DN2077_c0_g2_i2.p1  ORF type:complete len:534 (-),score=85.18 TRINITY_DN2077_c0_g2_i2:10643-12244(-)
MRSPVQNAAARCVGSRAKTSAAAIAGALVLSGCQVQRFDTNSIGAYEVAQADQVVVPFQVDDNDVANWLNADSGDLPKIEVRHTVEHVDTNMNALSLIGYIVTLSLIPGHDEWIYEDTMSLTWNDQVLLESTVDYTVDGYFSLYFPTPLLFLGTMGDMSGMAPQNGSDEIQKARIAANDAHHAQVINTVLAQKSRFDQLDLSSPEQIAQYLRGSDSQSVYRPYATMQLVELAPETGALAYHLRNTGIPGYVDLLTEQHQAWLIGPSGLTGLDLKQALDNGATEDELLVDMLNAYPSDDELEQAKIATYSADLARGEANPLSYYENNRGWVPYYPDFTDTHRDQLRAGGLPENIVRQMDNRKPSRELLIAAKTGTLRDENGNIYIPTEEELMDQLVRKDNRGQYMSPYTSDDVLAEWVNSAINANIGATAGSGLGAAAGAYVGQKALEQVPFVGSFLGGAIGSELGNQLGRQTAISASGGWEAIEGTSDRSFDDLQSMVRYLRFKYSDTQNFTDAMNAASQIYPELADALAQAY